MKLLYFLWPTRDVGGFAIIVTETDAQGTFFHSKKQARQLLLGSSLVDPNHEQTRYLIESSAWPDHSDLPLMHLGVDESRILMEMIGTISARHAVLCNYFVSLPSVPWTHYAMLPRYGTGPALFLLMGISHGEGASTIHFVYDQTRSRDLIQRQPQTSPQEKRRVLAVVEQSLPARSSRDPIELRGPVIQLFNQCYSAAVNQEGVSLIPKTHDGPTS